MEGRHPLVPEGSVRGEPGVELGEGFRPQTVDPSLRVVPHLNQSGLAQHPEVP